MKNKNILRIGISLIVTLFLVSHISAFAISAEYHEGNPLYILPGESKEVPFILQNLGGTSDVDIKLEIGTGKEFIKINDPSDIYIIPAGSRTSVNLTMSIPANAKLKEIYPVSLDFVTLSKSESGAFTLSSAISQRFNAIIGTGIPSTKPALNFTVMAIIAGLLAVGAFSYLAISKRRKHSE
jgi:hypothetical protein